MHSHFSVITDRVECVKRLQSIAYSRDFLGVKTDESKILSIIARYEVQLSTSTSALECTFNVFQTRSSFTNDFSHWDPVYFQNISNILNISNLQLVHERLLTPGSCSWSISKSFNYLKYFKYFKLVACSRTTSHTGIPGLFKIFQIS